MQYHPNTDDYRQFQGLPKMKVGAQKALCWATSEAIGEAQRMQDIIGHDTPWAPLFELAAQPSYRAMIVEFLSTFTFIPRQVDQPEEMNDPEHPLPPEVSDMYQSDLG
ncbi:hypothetical protein Hanom_Chr00s002382g01698401 [Helianthus anomalus]